MKPDLSADFFVLERKPAEGGQNFVEMIWSPPLPKFHFPSGDVDKNAFADNYFVKLKVHKLTGDYFLGDYLASERFLSLCRSLGVDFISAKADVALPRDKKPELSYNFFLPLERLDLLDEGKSIFCIAVDVETGEPQTKAAGLDSTYYDKIDLFKTREDVDRDLFLCTELKKVVCSARFKKKFEDAQTTGIGFEPIDQNFRYDPWGNFGSFGAIRP